MKSAQLMTNSRGGANGRNGEDDAAVFERLAQLSSERAVWVRVGQLIDGVSHQPLRNADLVLDQKGIRFVGGTGGMPPAELLAPGQNAPDAVLKEFTVLPCLVEAHAHLFLDGAPIDFAQREAYLKQSAEQMLLRGRARLEKILRCGVGTVRDAGDKHGVGLALAVEAKKRLGQLASAAWIDSPGAAIHHRGRYGSFMAEPLEEFSSPAECVAGRVAAGADRIKILATGIINFKVGRVTTPPQMSAEEVSQLVAAAKQHGRQTFAHASGTDGIENSIEGGVTTVEHGFFVTEEQLAKMRDRKVGWVPTFAPVQLQIDQAETLSWSQEVVGHLKKIIEGHQRMLCRANEIGTTIVAGSDAGSCGVPHGIGLLDELEQMEQAGLPAMAVLRSATGVSAEMLEFAEPIGRIVAGCRTRLIFTRHDPLVTVANLRREKIVWFDGAVMRGPDVDRADLESSENSVLAGL
jgi:imidazolonepropionase-like amidohydrolase